MPGSDFGAKKTSKRDKKGITKYNPKTIINQYFGFSSIVGFLRARNNPFQCQEVIIEPKNRQNGTKRDYKIFTQITLKRS